MKKFILVLLTLVLAALIALALFWNPILNYLNIDQSGWIVREDGRYYLDASGEIVTGWQEIDGNTYYFHDEDGTLFTGLCPIDLVFYYFDEQGIMQTGWIDGHYYTPEGPMAVGLTEIDGQLYYFQPDGYPAAGWQDVDGKRCYFGSNGEALTGWQEIDGSRYYLGEDSSLHTGWLELDGSFYYLSEDGTMATGWVQTEQGLFYLTEDGSAASGWVEVEGIRCYIGEQGRCAEGWQEIDGKRYYFNSDGSVHTGWLELDGSKYYLNEDGSAATGKLVIGGETFFFTSTGANILMVNPWNTIPADYQVELVELSDGHQIAKIMEEALQKMMADCEAAGHKPFLKSAYRTQGTQQVLFDNMVKKHGGNKTTAAQVVAIPGTSEHQLGLAVDITDFSYRDLDYDQEKTETQKWLMEHCWEYGFILRYPNEKSESTGIIYEPWHYRYVGTELSMELKDSGLCLEEYLDQLTPAETTA